MNFITIDLVKKQCRIDWYSSNKKEQRRIDDEIKECANKAEELVCDYIGKSYFDIIKEYGKVPVPIKQAALIATSELIVNGRPPFHDYSFQILLEPYKKN